MVGTLNRYTSRHKCFFKTFDFSKHATLKQDAPMLMPQGHGVACI